MAFFWLSLLPSSCPWAIPPDLSLVLALCVTCWVPLPIQEGPGMESGLARWTGLQSKSPRRGRLGSLNSWCASSHHPFCKAERRGGGSFLHPVAGENRKQQLASSQLESAHTESQILLSKFKCLVPWHKTQFLPWEEPIRLRGLPTGFSKRAFFVTAPVEAE